MNGGVYSERKNAAANDTSPRRRGAGGGNRTRTPLLAMDFESTSSTSSNTPAQYANYILWFMFFQVSLKIKESLDK